MNSSKGSTKFFNGLAMLVIAVITACTATKAVDMPPEQLQQDIINGHIIDVGDRVTITTRDGSRHCCWVHSINDNSVYLEVSAPADAHADDYTAGAGKGPQARADPVGIAISDIVAVEKTDLTAGGKAAGAAAGLGAAAAFWYVIFILLPIAIVGM
jgi:hypothetical protein